MNLPALSFPVDFPSFHAFLIANVANADGVVSTSEGCEVIEKNVFTQTDIDAVNEYYNALTQEGELAKITPTTTQIVAITISNAIAFGELILLQEATNNVLLGVTQAGKTGAVMDYVHELVHALITGSLYEAIIIIDGYIADTSSAKSNLSPFITNTRLTAVKNKIQTYLGVALT